MTNDQATINERIECLASVILMSHWSFVANNAAAHAACHQIQDDILSRTDAHHREFVTRSAKIKASERWNGGEYEKSAMKAREESQRRAEELMQNMPALRIPGYEPKDSETPHS